MQEEVKLPIDDNDSESENHPITLAIQEFIDDIDSLHTALPLTAAIIKAAHKQASNKLQIFLDENHLTKEIKDDKVALYLLEDKDTHEVNRLDKEMSNARLASKIIPRSFLVSLVSQYDAYLGALIKALFYLKPEVLNSSEKQLKFSDLANFSSIEMAKQHLVEKEVEDVLRNSHAEQFNWLEKKFDIKLREGLSVWKDFVEITERRNLFVHSNGIVSSQYLKNCSEHQIDLTNTPIGTTLEADQQYFHHAYNVFYEIGVKLAHVLWRKLDPKDRASADRNLTDIGFSLLYNSQFKMAQILFDFATSQKKCSDEHFRRIFIVNRAQSYKWQDKEERAREIMANEDWSAAKDVFQIAEAIIFDNFEKAAELMKIIGKNNKDLPVSGYKNWPLFKKFRETTQFLEAYRDVTGEDFNRTTRVEMQEVGEDSGKTSDTK